MHRLYARLIGGGNHAYPASKHAQAIDRVERLTAAVDLQQDQRAALGRLHRAFGQRAPVNMVFENGRQIAMLIGRAPDVAVLTELLHHGVVDVDRVPDWQARGTKDTHVTAQGRRIRATSYAASLEYDLGTTSVEQ